MGRGVGDGARLFSFHKGGNLWITGDWKAKTTKFNIRRCKFCPRGINPLNAELNPICHLLELAGAHHFVHVSRLRVNVLGTDLRTNIDYSTIQH